MRSCRSSGCSSAFPDPPIQIPLSRLGNCFILKTAVLFFLLQWVLLSWRMISVPLRRRDRASSSSRAGLGGQGMGTIRRSVRLASLWVCAVWVVSLVGFSKGEHAGFHTIQDSRTIVFSESDADVDSDLQSRAFSCVSANPTGVGSSFPHGSMNPPTSVSPVLRNGIGRLPTAVDQLIATTVLRP
jgi:hypothetical protein